MTNEKFIKNINGYFQETQGTSESIGSGSAGKIVSLDENGKLAESLFYFINDIHLETIKVTTVYAHQDLSAGDLVNIYYNSTGVVYPDGQTRTMRARKAIATLDSGEPIEANGFVREGVTAGEFIDVYFIGINEEVAGLTPGKVYYVSSSTPGIPTEVPPSGIGNFVQKVGVAVDSTKLLFLPYIPELVTTSETIELEAAENLLTNDLVNIFDDSGTSKIRKADASNNRRAHGFISSNITSGSSGTVYFTGEIISGLTSKTPGIEQYLSDITPGTMTETPPSTSGYIVQEIGIASDSTKVLFAPQQPVLLA